MSDPEPEPESTAPLPPTTATGERLAAENERSSRLRHVYEAIGLAVTAHKDGTLLLRWSFGERALPAVTEFESPTLGQLFETD